MRRGCIWDVVCAALLLAVLPAAAAAQCLGDCNADNAVIVNELVTGVALSLGQPTGTACAAFDRDRDQRVTIDELVTAVGNALSSCPSPPVGFTAALDPDGPALVLTPSSALHELTLYAVVLGDGVRDTAGRPLQRATDFKLLVGDATPPADGPVALFNADPEADDNPYPDNRLVQDGAGSVHIPDRIALRGLPDTPALATARTVLRSRADAVGAAGLFSTTAPIRIPLSAPVDLATVTADNVHLYARADVRDDLNAQFTELGRRRVARGSVALMISFVTQAVEPGLLLVSDRLDERAAAGDLRAVLLDPDPSDDLVVGVFPRGAPQWADFFAANPAVGTVVHGLLPSPEFRDAEGIFDPDRLFGEAAAPPVLLDFYLTLPDTPGPHRAVIVQHGFAGDNSFVLGVANELAEAGLAGIGISAVSHGRRGSALDLLKSTPLQLRDSFRQTIADQLALTRSIAIGIDADGDGTSDLQSDQIDYLGISLGGILGSTFIAVEPRVQSAVLNVAGGRVAFLGDNPGTRPIYTQYLATQAALDLQSPEFEIFLQRMLAIGQQALDPADPLNFARRWRLDPFPDFSPRRVLMQEGIGDTLVSNASTEALAAAGGLEANRAMEDANGVAGLWRFDPPGGHSIFGRADVRGQAFEFLRSRGTRIVAPMM